MKTQKQGKSHNFSNRQPCIEERLIEYVVSNAEEGNALDVLAKIDEFCSQNWMMNIGPDKGKYLRETIEKYKPEISVELGGYCGYSAVLIALSSPEDSMLFSIEFDPLHAAIATKIVEWAGLSQKVKVLIGVAETRIEQVKQILEERKIDLLFIDHIKELYLSDFELFEKSGLIEKGTVIFGDNIICPGAPDYLKYMQENQNYDSALIKCNLEYRPDTVDAVLISVRK